LLNNSTEEIDNLKVEIEKLKNELETLRGSWPVHSVKPIMMQRLEKLEEEIEEKQKRLNELTSH